MKKKLPAWLVLFSICAVCAVLLAVTFIATKSPIARQEAEAAQMARSQVLPAAETFENVPVSEGSGVSEMYRGVKGGQTVGYVAVVFTKGYGGEIEVTVGTDAQGVISGVNVGGANFSETAGLGARTKEESFTSRFIGLKAPLYPAKGQASPADGEERPDEDTAVTASETVMADVSETGVDVITSATISSSAVINAVSEGAMCILNLLQNP